MWVTLLVLTIVVVSLMIGLFVLEARMERLEWRVRRLEILEQEAHRLAFRSLRPQGSVRVVTGGGSC